MGKGLLRMPCRNRKMVVVVEMGDWSGEGGIGADTGDEVFGN